MTVRLFTQNKWLRRLAWALGGLLFLWGLAWLVLPPILKDQIERLATEQLGRTVTVVSVDFKPWSLELSVHDLAVARRPGSGEASPQFSIKRIYLDAELQSVFRLAPVLDAVSLEAPHLSLAYLGNGQYDISDILTRLTKTGAQPASQPQGFALYNLSLSSGGLDFDDKTLGNKHQLRDLQLSLPFLSNLESKRVVVVEPHLAFNLDGSSFDSRAQTMPFAQTQKTDASIRLKHLDLMPYMAYLPPGLPVKLLTATLSADLKLAFEQTPKAAVKISGLLQLDKVKLSGLKVQDAELLDFDLLKLTLDDVRPLEKIALLGAVELSAARLNVHRNQAGQLNLLALDAPKEAASGRSDKRADPFEQQSGKDATDTRWKLGIGKLLLGTSAIAFRDDSTQPEAHLALRELALEANGLHWPWVQPVPLTGSATLASDVPSTPSKSQKPDAAAGLSFRGEVGQQVSQLSVTVSNLPLSLGAPYLAQFMTPELAGKLNAELDLNWHGKGAALPAGQGEGLQLLAHQLSLDDLSLTQGKTRLASMKKLQLERAQLDLSGQKASVGKLLLSQPKLALGRDSAGRWMYQTWLKPAVQTAPSAVPQPAAAAITESSVKSPTQSKPWGLAMDELTLQGGALAFLDTAMPRPVAFDVSGLSLELKNFSSSSGKPFSTHVSAHIQANGDEPGQFDWRGSTALNPLVIQGKLSADKVPLHPFQAYLAEVLNIEMVRARAGFKGQIAYAQLAEGARISLGGDAELQDFQANAGAEPVDARSSDVANKAALAQAVPAGEELLRWNSLSLHGLNLALAPGQASQISVGETVLSDFFARLILSPAGRLNLQDLVKSPESAGASAQQTPVTLAPVISLGPISLARGQVHFSDRFIQPNYSANLTELTGSLGAFSSQTQAAAPKLAEVSLRGRAQSTASLEISGQINPLLSPPVLDLKGRVRDLELPPLSMYSVHYAGYGIERGKLSVDVSYQVQPDGQLVANNKLVLNQLSFGDKVEGAPGNLPVKLAVALLADSNGVIDIELPVSGSLNDPQFRLGPIVFKLIVNLIGKAIVSPFSLLASALGGGSDELSQVTFAPGSAALTEQAKIGLGKVAKALTQRPTLRMTVVGMANLESERDAYKRERLTALVQAQKGPSPPSTAVSEAEYPALLKAVYKKADFAKPRNLLGLVKDIPVDEMQALLLANLPAGEDAMRELALQRGLAVRDYLATQNLPTDRLFLGEPKAVPSEEKWSPRAQLSLTLP